MYHYCFWKAQGHLQDLVLLSDDILADGHKFNAVIEFFKNMTPVTQTMSLLFETIDRGTYHKYHNNYNQWPKEFALTTIHTCGQACFLVLAIVVNMEVALHKDSNNVKNG